jgi:hypothetical protein
MGVNAWVHCNCVKEGKAPAHPFPELLVFNETGEASLANWREVPLKQWLKHDAWYRNSCPHSGVLIEKRIGNIALVAHIRGFLETNSPSDFPLLLERVVYDGTHTGDSIATRDAAELLREARTLQSIADDTLVLEFAKDMTELADASLATANPIVF